MRREIPLDSIIKKHKRNLEPDYGLAKYILKNKNSSVLFSRRHGKVFSFTTNDSKLYFTQKELEKIRLGETVNFVTGKIDSVNYRQLPKVKYVFVAKKQDEPYLAIKEKYFDWKEYLKDTISGYAHGVSMARMWNISLVTSLIFGMFLMTMIYRYLGQGARAQEAKDKAEMQQTEKVLGESIAKEEALKKELDEYTAKLVQEYANKEQTDFKKELTEMVKGYPIEKMIPEIAKKDKIVAAFLIGIAKKESAWGKHVPVLNGKDCYNYWGFRGKREKMGSGRHTCFDSPKDAVDTVAKRIEFLVSKEKIDTPKEMVTVWKCGYDCSWDSKQAVQKWVDDVDLYFKKFDTN